MIDHIASQLAQKERKKFSNSQVKIFIKKCSIQTMAVMLVNHASCQGSYSGIIKIMIGDRPMEPKLIGIHIY